MLEALRQMMLDTISIRVKNCWYELGGFTAALSVLTSLDSVWPNINNYQTQSMLAFCLLEKLFQVIVAVIYNHPRNRAGFWSAGWSDIADAISATVEHLLLLFCSFYFCQLGVLKSSYADTIIQLLFGVVSEDLSTFVFVFFWLFDYLTEIKFIILNEKDRKPRNAISSSEALSSPSLSSMFIQNAEGVLMILRLLTLVEEHSQIKFFEKLILMTNLKVKTQGENEEYLLRNKQLLANEQVLRHVYSMYASIINSENSQHVSLKNLINQFLIELGTHRLSPRELNIVLSHARDHSQRTHTLLKYLSGEHKFAFFELECCSQKYACIKMSGQSSFDWHPQKGHSFSLWFNIRSLPNNASLNLIQILNESSTNVFQLTYSLNQGLMITFGKTCDIYLECNEIQFSLKRWYHIVINLMLLDSKKTDKKQRYSSDLSLYINGTMYRRMQKPVIYQVNSQTFINEKNSQQKNIPEIANIVDISYNYGAFQSLITSRKCHIKLGIDKGFTNIANKSMIWWLGPVIFFTRNLTPAQVSLIHNFGMEYSGLFHQQRALSYVQDGEERHVHIPNTINSLPSISFSFHPHSFYSFSQIRNQFFAIDIDATHNGFNNNIVAIDQMQPNVSLDNENNNLSIVNDFNNTNNLFLSSTSNNKGNGIDDIVSPFEEIIRIVGLTAPGGIIDNTNYQNNDNNFSHSPNVNNQPKYSSSTCIQNRYCHPPFAHISGGVTCIQPLAIEDSIRCCGGIENLFELIARSRTKHAFMEHCALLSAFLVNNPRNLMDMARLGGYEILGSIFKEKSSLMGPDIVDVVTSMALNQHCHFIQQYFKNNYNQTRCVQISDPIKTLYSHVGESQPSYKTRIMAVHNTTPSLFEGRSTFNTNIIAQTLHNIEIIGTSNIPTTPSLAHVNNNMSHVFDNNNSVNFNANNVLNETENHMMDLSLDLNSDHQEFRFNDRTILQLPLLVERRYLIPDDNGLSNKTDFITQNESYLIANSLIMKHIIFDYQIWCKVDENIQNSLYQWVKEIASKGPLLAVLEGNGLPRSFELSEIAGLTSPTQKATISGIRKWNAQRLRDLECMDDILSTLINPQLSATLQKSMHQLAQCLLMENLRREEGELICAFLLDKALNAEYSMNNRKKMLQYASMNEKSSYNARNGASLLTSIPNHILQEWSFKNNDFMENSEIVFEFMNFFFVYIHNNLLHSGKIHLPTTIINNANIAHDNNEHYNNTEDNKYIVGHDETSKSNIVSLSNEYDEKNFHPTSIIDIDNQSKRADIASSQQQQRQQPQQLSSIIIDNQFDRNFDALCLLMDINWFAHFLHPSISGNISRTALCTLNKMLICIPQYVHKFKHNYGFQILAKLLRNLEPHPRIWIFLYSLLFGVESKNSFPIHSTMMNSSSCLLPFSTKSLNDLFSTLETNTFQQHYIEDTMRLLFGVIKDYVLLLTENTNIDIGYCVIAMKFFWQVIKNNRFIREAFLNEASAHLEFLTAILFDIAYAKYTKKWRIRGGNGTLISIYLSLANFPPLDDVISSILIKLFEERIKKHKVFSLFDRVLRAFPNHGSKLRTNEEIQKKLIKFYAVKTVCNCLQRLEYVCSINLLLTNNTFITNIREMIETCSLTLQNYFDQTVHTAIKKKN